MNRQALEFLRRRQYPVDADTRRNSMNEHTLEFLFKLQSLETEINSYFVPVGIHLKSNTGLNTSEITSDMDSLVDSIRVLLAKLEITQANKTK